MISCSEALASGTIPAMAEFLRLRNLKAEEDNGVDPHCNSHEALQ